MHDLYGREITSLRFSVTQKCNLMCFYCHREGVNNTTSTILTLAHIHRIFKLCREMNIRKVKLTGGEPLCRIDILEIVKLGRKYFENVFMTTNGILLEQYAEKLKNVGLDRINISLHSLNEKTYEFITGKNSLLDVLKGIDACRTAGISPIKLNFVVLKNINDNEINEMIKFSAENNCILQIIELEPINIGKDIYEMYHYDLSSLENNLTKIAKKIYVRKFQNRKQYFIDTTSVDACIEIVKPVHNPEFCKNCTRLRITSNGCIKPCIFSQNGVNLYEALNTNAYDEEITKLIKKAILLRTNHWD